MYKRSFLHEYGSNIIESYRKKHRVVAVIRQKMCSVMDAGTDMHIRISLQ